jgi:hypothetical protein
MAVTATPIYPQAIVNGALAVSNVVTTLVAAGPNGTKVESITLTNTDTNAYTVQLYAVIAATNFLLGTVTVPLSSGNTAAAPPFALLTKANFPSLALDANTNPYLYLASGTALAIATTVAVTGGKTVAAFVQAGNY